MAEELKIIIDADVEGAKQGINSVTDVLNNFAKQGKLSISVIEQAMVQLRQIIRQTTDPADLRKLNAAFTELQNKLNSLKLQGGLEAQLQGVSRSTRIAHGELDQMSRSLAQFASGNERAVDTLSQVVFSFERLKGSTGSIGGAFSSLAETLLSPAGLLIGLTAVVAVIGPLAEKFFSLVDGTKQAKESLDALIASLERGKQALKDFGDEIDHASQIRTLNVDIAVGPGFARSAAELAADLDKVDLQASNLRGTLKALDADRLAFIEKNKQLQASIKPVPIVDLFNQAQRNAALQREIDANNVKAAKITAREKELNKEMAKLRDEREVVTKKQELTETDEKRKQQEKQTEDSKRESDKQLQNSLKNIEELNRIAVKRAKELSTLFNIRTELKFSIDDTSEIELQKAKDILEGIKDRTIRLRVISLTEDIPKLQAQLDNIKVPKLHARIDDKDLKQSIEDLAKGLTVPIHAALDKNSLLQTEDQIRQVFSSFSDTNIFTEFGRQAGTKFREALLQTVQIFNKGFTINPNIDISDVISSLTSSLAGIKDIQLKIIKTEDFNSAIRTLRDLHDAGVAAGEAVEKAFIAAGRSSEDANKAGEAIKDAFGGITRQTEDIAQALNSSLAPAFSNLFDAIIKGENPVKAFFESIIKSIEELASKLIGSAIEKAILSLVSTSASAATAIQATTTAISATSIAGAAAAKSAAAAAVGAATAAAAAQAAATAALIAAAAAKAATAAINPLSFIGSFLGFFAEGGEPPVGKPSIVGEKGPELFIPKVPGTIISHEKSVRMLRDSVKTDSVRESEKIKEYFITEKINQAFKEHAAKVSDSIKENIKIALVPVHTQLSDTIKSITSNNEKLTAYSYKLHEVSSNNIQSIKERFVTENKSISDRVEFNKLISSVTKVFNERVFKESFVTNNEKLFSLFKETVNKEPHWDRFFQRQTYETFNAVTNSLLPFGSQEFQIKYIKNLEKLVIPNRFISSIKDSIVNRTFSEKLESFERDRFSKASFINYFESFSDSAKLLKDLHSDASVVKEKENLFELSTILKTFSSSVSGSSLIKSDKFISSIQDKVTSFKERASSDYISVIHPEAPYGTILRHESKESLEKLVTSFRDQFRNNIESSVSNSTLSNILQRYENSQLRSLGENGLNSSTITNKSFSRITDSFTDYKLVNSFDKLKEFNWSGSFTDKLVNNFSDLKESFRQDSTNNIIKSFIENSSLKSFTGFESFVEKLNSTVSDKFTDSTSTKEIYKDRDSLKSLTNNILKSVFESGSTEVLKSVFKTFSSEKVFNVFKETFNTDKTKEQFSSFKQLNEKYTNQGFKESSFDSKEILSVLGPEKTSSIDREKTFYDSFERITSDIKNVISKIQVDKSRESYKSDLNLLTEKISNYVYKIDKQSYKSEISLLSEKINNSFSKLDKVTERINTSSARSFNVEKIINNNFITDSFRETFKTFSLEKLQREFHIPAFAGGGAVFGPTLAILGEGFGISRSNPEFVGTASQLKGIQGGTFDVNVNVNGDISFDMGKLALALNREERSHLRTNGKRPF